MNPTRFTALPVSPATRLQWTQLAEANGIASNDSEHGYANGMAPRWRTEPLRSYSHAPVSLADEFGTPLSRAEWAIACVLDNLTFSWETT